MKIILGLLLFTFGSYAAEQIAVGFRAPIDNLQTNKLLVEKEVLNKSQFCANNSQLSRESQWNCNKFSENVTCKSMFVCEKGNDNTKEYQSMAFDQKIKKTLRGRELFDADFRVVLLKGSQTESFQIRYLYTKEKLVAKSNNSKVSKDDYYQLTDKEYFAKLNSEEAWKKREAIRKKKKKAQAKRLRKMRSWKDINISIINAFDDLDRSLRTLDLAWTPFFRPSENWEFGLNLGVHFIETSSSLTSFTTDNFMVADMYAYIGKQSGKYMPFIGAGTQKWFNDADDSYSLTTIGCSYDIGDFWKRVFIQYSSISNPTKLEEFKVGITLSFM